MSPCPGVLALYCHYDNTCNDTTVTRRQCVIIAADVADVDTTVTTVTSQLVTTTRPRVCQPNTVHGDIRDTLWCNYNVLTYTVTVYRTTANLYQLHVYSWHCPYNHSLYCINNCIYLDTTQSVFCTCKPCQV